MPSNRLGHSVILRLAFEHIRPRAITRSQRAVSPFTSSLALVLFIRDDRHQPPYWLSGQERVGTKLHLKWPLSACQIYLASPYSFIGQRGQTLAAGFLARGRLRRIFKNAFEALASQHASHGSIWLPRIEFRGAGPTITALEDN